MTHLRNVAVMVLVVVAFSALALANVPGWENARLVGLLAGAIVATDLLSRGSSLP